MEIIFRDPNLNNVEWEITKQESKDRYIIQQMLPLMLNQQCSNLKVNSTPLRCSVDLECSVDTPEKTINFNIEVKHLTHFHYESDEEAVLLKWKKLMGMKEYSKGKLIFYITIVNNKAYVFNINGINWNTIPQKWLCQKVTELDPYSQYAYYKTFYIPTRLAIRVIDVTEIIDGYNKKTGKA